MQESHQLSGSDRPHARQRAPLRFTLCREEAPVFISRLRQRLLGRRDPHRQHPAYKRPFTNKIKLMPEVLPTGGRDPRHRLQLLRRERQPGKKMLHRVLPLNDAPYVFPYAIDIQRRF